MKPIYKPTPAFFLALAVLAGLAVPSLGSPVVLPAAAITTSLDQCESQICGSSPFLASYNGLLSSFPGMQTVGEGTSVTATGFAAPGLTSQVPLGGANALLAAELTYYLEVVPINGSSTVTPVQIGVSAVGSTFAATTANPALGLQSGANTNITLELLSGAGGVAVFQDTASVVYNALENAPCAVTNRSTSMGAGFVSTPGSGGASISCTTSYMFGGFTESGSYSISTNSLYEVAMIANIQIGTTNDGNANGPGTVQANASVDPIFTVPAGYELVMSAGVGNGASTPEPATWTMFAAGAGLMILAKKRRVNRASLSGARGR